MSEPEPAAAAKEALACGCDEESYVGQRVYLQGTGTWWSGSNFAATIVDINDDNHTVKVQYTDGGFKRFAKEEFNSLLICEDVDHDLHFGTRDYEWSHDQYNHVAEVEDEVTRLQHSLQAAVEKRDFLEAHELKQKLRLRMENAAQIRQREVLLAQLVSKQDFLAAAEVQVEIEALTRGAEKFEEKKPVTNVSFDEIIQKATKRALGGGLAGAAAMIVQVSSLMWMRTAMNYQYRYGTSTKEAMKKLYKEGGIRRFYKGYPAALLQGPLSRFGDTAANVGVLTLLDSMDSTRNLPVGIKTFFASSVAAAWRIVLMPIDTVKTSFQVEGSGAWSKLIAKQRASGPTIWYHGALGASAATFAGHYPWFATYNFLDSIIPLPAKDETLKKLARNASMGFCASVVSDTTSNSLRVMKTFRQTSEVKVSYPAAARAVIEKDGLRGLFGRGLKTRIMTNGIQGVTFSVAWKYLDEQLRQKNY